jgi:hypothetical protein
MASRWQQYMVVRATNASVVIAVSTFAEKCYIVCIFIEIVLLPEYPPRAMTYISGSV